MKNVRYTHLSKLQILAVLALAGGQVQAVNLIPNPGFQMYKAGTGETVTAEFPAGNNFTGSFEGVVTVNGSVTFSDGSGGNEIVMPGWENILAPGPGLFNLGVDGSTSLETVAGWGGSNGDIVGTTGSMGAVSTVGYTLSALVKGASSGDPSAILSDLTLDLLADGVVIPPTSATGP